MNDVRRRLHRKLFGSVAAARQIGVTIGEGCRIYSVNFGSEPWLVKLGNRVTVTSGVRFLTHDGALWLLRDENGRRYRFLPIEVGSDVFIGVNSILMPGVRIEDRCVVAAGSVVTKSVPAGSVVAGVPARVISTYAEWRERSMRTCPSDADMVGVTERERIDSVVTREFRPFLENPREATVSVRGPSL